MNINKLKKGMVIKNYKELCKLLEEPIKAGRTRQNQMEWFKHYFKYHKKGHKFIIDKVYYNKQVKPMKDNRGKNPKSHHNKKPKKYKNLKVPEEYWNAIGVYKITLDNSIYIGSTITGFRKRFQSHRRKDNTLPTKQMLKNGGVFEILEICNNLPEKEIRKREGVWIKYFANNDDWNIVNQRNGYGFAKKYKPKQKYKNIKLKIEKKNYNKAMQILKNYNLWEVV